MKHVIVLMDNENRRSYFINDSLGRDPALSLLCMRPSQAMIDARTYFKFDVFGLFVDDDKLNDYISSRNGIIISIDIDNFIRNKDNFMTRITEILESHQTLPIAVVIDSRQFGKTINFDDIINWFNEKLSHKYHKLFVFDNSYNKKKEIIYWFNSELEQNMSKKLKIITSETINAKDLMDKFADGTLEIELWNHYGRLRVVWCSIVRFGFDQSIDPDGWLCNSWKKYKISIGHGDRWNYTLTRFWITLLYNIQKKYNYKSFKTLYDSTPYIHSGKLFEEYYTREIFSDQARQSWIEPTKKSLLNDH